MSAPEAQLCTFSFKNVLEGGVDNVVDPGKVVHNLLNRNFMQRTFASGSSCDDMRLHTSNTAEQQLHASAFASTCTSLIVHVHKLFLGYISIESYFIAYYITET